MKTIEQIVEKIRQPDARDIFGTVTSDLLSFLPFAQAREFLKPEITDEVWASGGYPHPLTEENVIGEIKRYMPFAWEKANDCRGLSAGRSLQHMQTWLWLLDADEAAAGLDNYSHYGKPQLRAICEELGINWAALDDGRWRNDESSYGVAPLAAAVLVWPAHLAGRGLYSVSPAAVTR